MRELCAFTVVAWVLFAPAQALSQTHWFKFEGNPVLVGGPPGAWDNSASRIDRVIRSDSGYHMWYTGYKGGVDPGQTVFPHIGHATSRDGVVWTKDVSNPVLVPGPSGWDGEGAFRPYVLKTGSGYSMWYTAVGSGPTFRVGYARSPDGQAWKKRESGIPVLNPGDSWESDGVEHPSVLTSDSSGGFQMWYQGIPGFHFGFATSPDETTWTKNASNPAFVSYGPVFYPRILPNGQEWHLWFSYSQPQKIGYAIATDEQFMNRIIQAPVLSPGPGGQWDSKGVLPGDVLLDGSLYHMWYAGRNEYAFRSGYAVSPKGLSWSVLPARSSLDRTKDTVRVIVRVADRTGLSFSVVFETPGGSPIDTLALYDDGSHGDSTAADGVFSNFCIMQDRSPQFLDLRLHLHDTLDFDMKNIHVFDPVQAISSDGTALPGEVWLGQNYPNPFNPGTAITYQVPDDGAIKLAVYDILGREVAVLVDERKTAGRYEVYFDGEQLSSGVYVYRLIAGMLTQSRRMIVLR